MTSADDIREALRLQEQLRELFDRAPGTEEVPWYMKEKLDDIEDFLVKRLRRVEMSARVREAQKQ
jgi:hypothetical protein